MSPLISKFLVLHPNENGNLGVEREKLNLLFEMGLFLSRDVGSDKYSQQKNL